MPFSGWVPSRRTEIRSAPYLSTQVRAISGGSEESVLPIVLAVAFLVVSFVAVWLFDVKVRKTESRHATVIRVLTEAEAEASPRIEIVKFGG